MDRQIPENEQEGSILYLGRVGIQPNAPLNTMQELEKETIADNYSTT